MALPESQLQLLYLKMYNYISVSEENKRFTWTSIAHLANSVLFGSSKLAVSEKNF